jgi:hypothetical protein
VAIDISDFFKDDRGEGGKARIGGVYRTGGASIRATRNGAFGRASCISRVESNISHAIIQKLQDADAGCLPDIIGDIVTHHRFAQGRLTAFALLALFLLTPVAAFGGTLCGTVRDAQTAAPLSGALVLAYHTDGAWAGHAAITGADGSFCMETVPAGTYDLQVRVNNHLVGTLKDVVVTEGTSGVDIDGMFPALLLAAYPNPARSGTRIVIGADEAAWARVSVHDVRGRFLRGWSVDLAGGADRTLSWDFRDRDGRNVPAGLYFLRLVTDVGSTGRRVVRLP